MLRLDVKKYESNQTKYYPYVKVFEVPLNACNKKYRKTHKISDARKLSCNTSKIQIKGPNLRVFLQIDSNGIANSEDPDQTGAV